ncbi:hypothetical protein H6S26_10290 [Escherichia coli]|nr:hypothetical protein H6S26_10290 [Escherichia coli]
MTISALKEIEMQFCQILRLCAVLMTKADKKVVIFFHNMISVRFLPEWKTMIFLSVLPHFARFSVIARVDKRLQFSQARKSSTVHRKKITSIPWLKYRVS